MCRTNLGVKLCPYHILEKVVDVRIKQGAKDGDPLFSTLHGAPPSYAGIIASWRTLVHIDAVTDDWGERTEKLITCHSPRRVGAQWLTKFGLSLWQVMYIGRWGSQTVERYVAEAAAWENSKLSSMAASSSRALCGALPRCESDLDADISSNPPWWIVKDELARIRACEKSLSDIRSELHRSAEQHEGGWRNVLLRLSDIELKNIAAECSATERTNQTCGDIAPYVINAHRGTFHQVLVDGPLHSPRDWVTRCGCKFGLRHFTRSATMASKGVCKVCFPEHCCEKSSGSNSSSGSSS